MMHFDFRPALLAGFLVVLGPSGFAQESSEPAPGTDSAAAAESTKSESKRSGSRLTDVSDEEFQKRSRPLFDGVILAGWEGNAYWFTTQGNAVIAGRLEKPVPKNQFLCTTETFDDFDLRLEVRMRGKNPNAGVQFRSRRPRSSDNVPANEVVGYQADMGIAWGRSVWGALYDESRRNKMLAEPETPFDVSWSTPESDATENTVPESEWVRMRIVCQGDQVEIFLNDTSPVRYTETEPEIPRSGMIGLQIHSGPPAEAWYRNIRILSL